MEALRESWTDERLDDLRVEMREGFKAVGDRFDRVEAEIVGVRTELHGEAKGLRGELRGEIKGLRGEMKSLGDELRGEMKDLSGELRSEIKDLGKDLRLEMGARFNLIDARLDSLQRTLIWFCGSMFVSLIGLLATFVVTQA